MISRASLKRRLILSALVGSMLTAFLIICLAGFGRIRPEPTLGVLSFVFGAIIWFGVVWRWAKRNSA